MKSFSKTQFLVACLETEQTIDYNSDIHPDPWVLTMNGIRMTLVSAMRMSSLSQESRGLSGSGIRLHSSGSRRPPAVLCSAACPACAGCSQVVGLGLTPPGPSSAQASSSSYSTLLQHVKVALRAQAQPPPGTGTVDTQTVFSWFKRKGKVSKVQVRNLFFNFFSTIFSKILNLSNFWILIIKWKSLNFQPICPFKITVGSTFSTKTIHDAEDAFLSTTNLL